MAKMYGTQFFHSNIPYETLSNFFHPSFFYKQLGNQVFLLQRSTEQQFQRNVCQYSREIKCKLPSAWKNTNMLKVGEQN